MDWGNVIKMTEKLFMGPSLLFHFNKLVRIEETQQSQNHNWSTLSWPRSLGVTCLCCCPVVHNVIKWDAVGKVTQREWSEIAEMQKLNPLRGTKMESKYKNCMIPHWLCVFSTNPQVSTVCSHHRDQGQTWNSTGQESLYLPSTDDFCHSAGFQKKKKTQLVQISSCKTVENLILGKLQPWLNGSKFTVEIRGVRATNT